MHYFLDDEDANGDADRRGGADARIDSTKREFNAAWQQWVIVVDFINFFRA